MTPSTLVLRAIGAKLGDRGVSFAVESNALVCPDLSCSVRCAEIEGDFHPMMKPFSITAAVPVLKGTVNDDLAAVGDSLEQQVEYAARVWTETVFDPLHDLIHRASGIEPLAMVTTASSGELIGWQAFTTNPATSGAEPAGGRLELLQHLVQQLNPRLSDRQFHSLKCFVSKQPGAISAPGDHVSASCHFDGVEWLEGLSALLYVGDEWGEVRTFKSRRQWIFFKPATRDELGDSWDKITRHLAPAKPWWKFW